MSEPITATPEQWARLTQQVTGLEDHLQLIGFDQQAIAAQLHLISTPMLPDVFHWPIGTPAQRIAHFPDPWWIAVKYTQAYSGGIHTGDDWNLAGFGDSGQPIYCMANGTVVFAGYLNDAWLKVIVVKHTLITGKIVFTRYAHVEGIRVAVGQILTCGHELAVIGDYPPFGKKDGDHLHNDVADGDAIDLGANPGHWPGNNLAEVKRCYIDPVLYVQAHLGA